MEEQWKTIENFEGFYEISNLGRVKSLKRKKISKKDIILKGYSFNGGYIAMDLYKYAKRYKYLVHRLVAEAFIDNPENKPYINHINNNPSDNRVENLEWCTQKENVDHTIKQNRNRYGSNCSYSKLQEKDVLQIRELVYNNEISQTKLAKEFGVAVSTLNDIIKRRTWKQI